MQCVSSSSVRMYVRKTPGGSPAPTRRPLINHLVYATSNLKNHRTQTGEPRNAAHSLACYQIFFLLVNPIINSHYRTTSSYQRCSISWRPKSFSELLLDIQVHSTTTHMPRPWKYALHFHLSYCSFSNSQL